MKKKCLVIGSINKDLVANTTRFPLEGETILGTSFYTNDGGKGANQAAAISKLGGDVSILGAVGDDSFGDECLKTLISYGVNTKNVVVKTCVSTGVAIITVTESGANNIIVVPAANYELTEKDIDDKIEAIKEADIVIIQLEIPIKVAEYAAVIAKKLGKTVILNPSPISKLSKSFLEAVDILIPNEVEMETLGNIEEIKKLGIKYIIVTLGKNGCEVHTKNEKKHFDAYNMMVVDTTAAGDSFLGAIARILSENEKITDDLIKEAALFAIKVSNITVTRKGAIDSIPTFDEVIKTDFK